MNIDRTKIGWLVVAAGAGYLASKTSDGATRAGWRAVTGVEPPAHPESPATPWRDALIWTAASSLTFGIGRLLTQRLAAAGWQRVVGAPPPV